MTIQETKDIINFIEEGKVNISDRWYYHFSPFDLEKYRDILTSGIKSRFSKNGKIGLDYSWNGNFYISVIKRPNLEQSSNMPSVYSLFYPQSPMFIIDENIKSIKCRYVDYLNFLSVLLSNSILPFRFSDYIDEWHVFNIIKPQDIIGLQYAISSILFYDINNLRILIDIVKLLDEIGIDLPIYDFETCKEINKKKCLELKLLD